MGALLWKALKIFGPLFLLGLAIRWWRGVPRDRR
jgi:hypothetical protein